MTPPPPPQWKGCGAAGAIAPGLIRGAAPEMGLIKGVWQGKGGASPLQSQPTYTTNPQCHNYGMLGVGEVKGSQLGRVKVKVTRMRVKCPLF